MRLALVITTHERPEALAAVLDSVGRQHVAPDEIVIADDGSGSTTQQVITAFASRSAVPVRVVSQPHEGFRAARREGSPSFVCVPARPGVQGVGRFHVRLA